MAASSRTFSYVDCSSFMLCPSVTQSAGESDGEKCVQLKEECEERARVSKQEWRVQHVSPVQLSAVVKRDLLPSVKRDLLPSVKRDLLLTRVQPVSFVQLYAVQATVWFSIAVPSFSQLN